MEENKAMQGFIELIERRYELKVIDSQYIKLDDKYDTYNMMLDLKLPAPMMEQLKVKYPEMDSANHVAWSFFKDRVRFYAEIGNNILLLLDTLK
jgi:hypothetical protein